MNRDETAKLVAVMLAAVPSNRIDARQVPSMIDAYADLLGDLSYAQCNAALRVLLQTRTWLPSVADIRGAVTELLAGPVRGGGDAWGEVLRTIAAKGAYREPGRDFAFQDPITARCVSAFGWKSLCLSENATADRARFIELYDKLAAQGRRETQAPSLGAASEHRQLEQGNATELVSGLALRLAGGRS